MTLLAVALAATAAGVVLVLLVGAGRRPPAGAQEAPGRATADLDFVRARGAEGLERLLVLVFAELGFTAERTDRGARAVDLYAVDPAPIRGAPVYVRGVVGAPGEAVDGGDVRAALDVARADAIGKVVLVTLGRFTDAAREAARDQPVELVDGAALAALVRRHLPQVWATRTL